MTAPRLLLLPLLLLQTGLLLRGCGSQQVSTDEEGVIHTRGPAAPAPASPDVAAEVAALLRQIESLQGGGCRPAAAGGRAVLAYLSGDDDLPACTKQGLWGKALRLAAAHAAAFKAGRQMVQTPSQPLSPTHTHHPHTCTLRSFATHSLSRPTTQVLPDDDGRWVGSCSSRAGWRCYFDSAGCTSAALLGHESAAAADPTAAKLWAGGAAWGVRPAAAGWAVADSRAVVVWSACGNQMNKHAGRPAPGDHHSNDFWPTGGQYGAPAGTDPTAWQAAFLRALTRPTAATVAFVGRVRQAAGWGQIGDDPAAGFGAKAVVGLQVRRGDKYWSGGGRPVRSHLKSHPHTHRHHHRHHHHTRALPYQTHPHTTLLARPAH